MEERKTKVCSKCGRELPVEMFSKASSNKDGLHNYCKPCSAEASRQYREKKEAERAAVQHAANLAGTDADRITTTDCKSYRKVDYSPVKELKDYKPYELFAELKRRGYKWPDNTIYMKMYVNWDKIEI